jgi:hypothetical protein
MLPILKNIELGDNRYWQLSTGLVRILFVIATEAHNDFTDCFERDFEISWRGCVVCSIYIANQE